MARKIKCLDCNQRFDEATKLTDHIELAHPDKIPQGWSAGRYYRLRNFGQAKGKCLVCGADTPFNEKSYKYKRYCGSKACKDAYVAERNARMMKKYNKTTLLDDPDMQKKMLKNRSISGEYKWSDGVMKDYVGSYEKACLEYLDVVMEFNSDDIITPSPNVYKYMHDDVERFYFGDIFIISLNAELEIKDGGDNPNMHHKIQAVDKVKEKLKDEVLRKEPNVNYIKVVNKNHEAMVRAIDAIRLNNLSKKDERVKVYADGNDIDLVDTRAVMESSTEEEVNLDTLFESLGINPAFVFKGGK